MSDAGRKGFGEKASEALKPDSQKSYAEQGKEYITDKADKVAGKVQPEDNKGVFQGVNDSAEKGKDNAEGQGESLADQARDYMGAAKSKLNDAVEYVSGRVHGEEDPTKK
ncbi:BAK_1a_G0016720.mRNA.1.CDS.1 [Saccharomyces cerevisiae]|nr:Hsp12p [Saccharomyces cerevisiae YJM1418]CAD6626421.1 HLJ1_G0050190.mRNA.1.CDS.1 [Saccharomyces cerevisiae]CAI4436138.1 BAK_1a_G0016720.mRNA.1.CDS.1 [Saccharomyces cerevisiae]CAI4440584.1 BAI_1a_G0016750.mRNA.1.CDS.1 [Saccharomyces cerevisiae]CAI4443750.1 CCN_G0016830.mRNA.1.CDS.1 [Saccharomyces cerevisiae]